MYPYSEWSTAGYGCVTVIQITAQNNTEKFERPQNLTKVLISVEVHVIVIKTSRHLHACSSILTLQSARRISTLGGLSTRIQNHNPLILPYLKKDHKILKAQKN